MRSNRRLKVRASAVRSSSTGESGIPPAPVSGHQPLGGQAHRIDAAEKLRAEPQATEGSEREGRRHRPAESEEDAAQDRVGAAPLVADDEG